MDSLHPVAQISLPQKRQWGEGLPRSTTSTSHEIDCETVHQGHTKKAALESDTFCDFFSAQLGRSLVATRALQRGEVVLVEDALVSVEASPRNHDLLELIDVLSGEKGPSAVIDDAVFRNGEVPDGGLQIEGLQMKWSESRASSLLAFLEHCSALPIASKRQLRSDFDHSLDANAPLSQLVRATADQINASGIFQQGSQRGTVDRTDTSTTLGFLTCSEVLIFCMIKVVNCHQMFAGGVGLFPQLSRLAHHCAANCVYTPVLQAGLEGTSPTTHRGRLVAVRAIRVGEILSIAYMPQTRLLYPRGKRRAALFLVRGFWCACTLCMGHDLLRPAICPCAEEKCRAVPKQDGHVCSWYGNTCNQTFADCAKLHAWTDWLESTEDLWLRKLESLRGRELVLLDGQTSESSNSDSETSDIDVGTPELARPAKQQVQQGIDDARRAANLAQEKLSTGHWLSVRFNEHLLRTAYHAVVQATFTRGKMRTVDVLTAVSAYVEAAERRKESLMVAGVPIMLLDEFGIEVRLAHKVLLAIWKQLVHENSSTSTHNGLACVISKLQDGTWPQEFDALCTLVDSAGADAMAVFGAESAQAGFAQRVRKEWDALQRLCITGGLAANTVEPSLH